MSRYITLDENNRVASARYGKEIVPGEIQSDLGECGDLMQADGSFITLPSPEPLPDPSIELRTNIASATTLEELKSALLGKSGKAKVKGEIV